MHRRQQWRVGLTGLDPRQFVVLDETATPTNLSHLRARAPRGERAVGRVPRRRWTSAPLVSTLRATGMSPAVVLDGATDRAAFDAFVGQLLVPTLRPGQIVVLDNLSVHKSAVARAHIEGAGCHLLFLPPYSPDFNPIELAFAKIKQTLRAVAARIYDALVTATGPALDAITPADAQGFFAHCGFAASGQLL